MDRQESDSVIHDIGFRHYDGPRMGRGWVVRSLLIETVRGVFALGRPGRHKAMPWTLVGLVSLGALIQVVVLILTGSDDFVGSYIGYVLGAQFLFMLFVAGRAPDALSRDLRYGVMPLYFARPIKRTDYVLAKYGGLALGVFIFGAIPEFVLFTGRLLGKLPIMEQVWGFLGGLIVCALLAVIISVIALAIASITPKRGLGVAAIMGTFIILSGIANLLADLAANAGNRSTSGYLLALDPFNLINGIAVALLHEDPNSFGRAYAPTGIVAGLVMVAALAAIAAACLGFLFRRYRKVGGL